VGFLFSKKTKLVCVFLENKKDKILGKNLGFYACSGFPTWDARSESLFV